MKSDDKISIIPITYIDHRVKSKYVDGTFGLKKKHYHIVEEKIGKKALFQAPRKVRIEAGKDSESKLENVDIQAEEIELINIKKRSRDLAFHKEKIGSGLSPEGVALLTAVKVGVGVAATIYLGPYGGAATSGLFNTVTEIGIERTNEGLRNKDEWSIARKHGKNALISMD